MLIFARSFGAALAAAASLARRRYLAAFPAVFAISLLSVLSTYAETHRIAGLLVFILQIGYLTAWVIGTRNVYVAYTRPAEAERGGAVDPWTTVKQMWTVGWPLLVLTICWLIALMIVSPIPGAATIVLYGGSVATMAGSMVAGWAFTFVVTEGVEAKTARERVLRSLSDRRVPATALAAAVVITALWNASLFLAELLAEAISQRARTGPFPHPPGTPLEVAFQLVLDLVYWPFTYALVLVTRPAVDFSSSPMTPDAGASPAAPPSRRRSEIVVPGWLDWTRRLFRDPPNRAG